MLSIIPSGESKIENLEQTFSKTGANDVAIRRKCILRKVSNAASGVGGDARFRCVNFESEQGNLAVPKTKILWLKRILEMNT